LNPICSYGTSLAIWDHTVYLLPDTSEHTPPYTLHTITVAFSFVMQIAVMETRPKC